MTIEKKETTAEEEKYTTSDIGIAAYLQLCGKKLLQCHRQPDGRFFFEFSDPEECQKKAIEFLSSDFCKFDNIVRNLKKILFS